MAAKAAPTRRLGVEHSETRSQLIDAATDLIRVEGWAAVTARRLAEEFGLKRQIVHYYFGTIEDLLIAVIRRNSEKFDELFEKALAADEPLRAIWELGNQATAQVYEFSAMALRHEAIQIEMKGFMEHFRKRQIAAIAHHLEQRGIKPATPPAVTAILINGISYVLAGERALNVTHGHAEMKAMVEQWLQAFADHGDWTTARYPAARI
jgi:AcrR family transcriptional regulator